MKVKMKEVYFCDFCKKKGLSRYWMENHEKYCTLNPNRECRLCKRLGIKNDIPALVQKYKGFPLKEDYMESDLLENIKQDVDYCPNCQLTILRLIGSPNTNWDYKKAILEFWECEKEDI